MTVKLHLAIKDMVDAYNGTQLELAELLGVNPHTFRNKVKPNKDDVGAHFTAAELERLMLVTGDVRVLQTLAVEFGYDLVRRIDEIAGPDDLVFHAMYCLQHGSDDEADMRQWLSRCDLKKTDVLASIHTMVRRLMGLAGQIHG